MTALLMSENAPSDHLKNLLGPEQMDFIKNVHLEMNPERLELLNARQERQQAYDKGEIPGYLPEGEAQTDWKVKAIPEDLQQRRVEITGPINDPKMVINMLSRNGSGDRADTAMLDFEDSMKPSWKNVVDGLQNIVDVANGNLSFEKKDKDGNVVKKYQLDASDMAKPMVRVRGLHLQEANLTVNGEAISGGMFDLVATSLLTAKTFIENNQTPKFYVPKCEHFLEARWWNKLFNKVEEHLGLEIGTIRATFLIETLPAALQVEEILFELKDHAAGLNVGRWDKIFSDIKVLKSHADRLSPDRSQINMQKFWMDNYAKRLIKICHEHGAFAIGGMSAFTPGSNEDQRQEQTNKVLQDKKNEFSIGHDGCWVSHPYFIGPALAAFPKKNQVDELLPEMDRYPDLIMDGKGEQTLQGLRTNIRVGIAYLKGWQSDLGCIAWDNMMEDLATLEISRAQVWQWLHHKVQLSSGESVDKELVSKIFGEELDRIFQELKIEEGHKEHSSWLAAMEKARQIFTQEKLEDFLTSTSEIYHQK